MHCSIHSVTMEVFACVYACLVLTFQIAVLYDLTRLLAWFIHCVSLLVCSCEARICVFVFVERASHGIRRSRVGAEIYIRVRYIWGPMSQVGLVPRP